ncbi:MAG TPA: GAF and ANTAR domain-containing protein [Ilumatobacteraceae bacterium]
MSESVPLFQAAVASLTRYFVGNQTLDQTLHEVAELTIEAIPPTDHVGITLLVDGRLKTSVFTHPEVPEIDQAQYRTGDGPCIDAYRTGAPYLIRSTLQRGRWQEFRDSAARHGVLSTLSLPMIIEARPIGALNMYAEVEDAFGEEDQRVAQLFATQAAFLLANAQAYWDARALSENLEQAMKSRAVIEQAKGIIISTTGCDADEAIGVLIEQSQNQNIKLRDIAAEVVRNASRQSRPSRPSRNG